ncbi:uncharacterized protein LOC142814197 isoform X3 [Rhipicephalus microplus]|uniref:uncharacterized protein LOC142814197 isoform X3 n=1 Tax=Rhipicephalus microplus TaxID=6941 RepID=UPI003F6C0532
MRMSPNPVHGNVYCGDSVRGEVICAAIRSTLTLAVVATVPRTPFAGCVAIASFTFLPPFVVPQPLCCYRGTNATSFTGTLIPQSAVF